MPAALPARVQEAAQAGCADGSSGEAADKLKPGLDDKALKALLTQGQAAKAKVGGGVGGWLSSLARATGMQLPGP